MTTKPTLILVPGAWHTPAHYELLITELTRHKFKCVTVSLPSVGPKLDEMPNSIDADIKAIQAAVTKEVASGSNVAVIALLRRHSGRVGTRGSRRCLQPGKSLRQCHRADELLPDSSGKLPSHRYRRFSGVCARHST
jgi:hypothetical protein